jgi:zinc protease
VVLYSIGNDHDPAGRSGLGHMVEHLYVTAAAGGEKARTAEEFGRRYPDGANGQTGDRYTVFATVFPEQELTRELKEAAARMADLRPTAEDLDRERRRLLDEVENMFAAIPPLAAQNNARELVRPAARGGRRGGLPEEIRSLSLEDVRGHWKRFYKPRNAILVLAGAVDSRAARRAISEHLAKLEAGEPAPTPGEPGPPKFGARPRISVTPLNPQAQPMATLAYLAPQPGTPQYAPFLVLVARLWAGAAKLGGTPGSFPVYFTPLDDGAIVAVSVPATAGEDKAFTRLETFVDETIKPELRDSDLDATQQQLGFLLGLAELPDNILAQNPYGVAFALGRREQIGLDPARLKTALRTVTDRDLRHVASTVFAPARYAGAYIQPVK